MVYRTPARRRAAVWAVSHGAGPTLGTLGFSTAFAVGTAIAGGAITGATAGSSIAGPAGITVSGAGTTRSYSGTPTTAGASAFVETLAGATGSPKSTAVTVAAAAIVLGTLSLSTALTIGTAASGTISGATAGSTIASNIPGITVNSAARTYAGTPTGSAATIANGLVETLGGATGSPKSSPVSVVAAAAVMQAARFKTAMGAVIDNTADAYWLTVGDSTRMGNGAGNPSGTAAARSRNPSAKFAEGMLAKGYKVSTDAFFGTSAVTTTPPGTEYNLYYTAAEPLTGAVTVDASWSAGAATLGGGIWTKASATAGAITFAPKLLTDTFDVYTAGSGAGVLVVKIDGVEVKRIDPAAGAGTTVKTTITVALGTPAAHVISFDSADATTTYFLGCVARSSVTKRLIVVNAGARGWTTSSWNVADTAWRPMPMIDLLKPVGSDISLMINDLRDGGGTTAKMATATTNMNAIVDKLAQYGDVFMQTPNRIAPASDIGPDVFMADADALYKSMASARGLNIIDTLAVVGGYSAGAYMDALHPLAPFAATSGSALATAVDTALAATPYQHVVLSGAALPGNTGRAYSFVPSASLGNGAKTFTQSGTALPAWATFNPTTGAITGSSATAGTTNGIVIRVTDNTGFAEITVSLVIQAALVANFAGAANSSITAYTADSPTGVTFTTSAGATVVLDGAGNVYTSVLATAAGATLSTYQAGVAAQYVEGNLNWITSGSNQQNYLVVRAQDDLNYISAGYRKSAGAFVIGSTTAGAASSGNLASAVVTLPTVPIHMRVEDTGTNVRLLVTVVSDGSVLADINVNTNLFAATAASARAGFTQIGGASTSTTNARFSAFRNGPL